MYKKIKTIAICMCLVFCAGNTFAATEAPLPLEKNAITLQESNDVSNDVIAQQQTTDNTLIQIKKDELPPPVEVPKELKAQVDANIFNYDFKKTFETGIIKDVSLVGGNDLVYNGFRQSNGVSHNMIDSKVSLWGFQGHFRDGTLYNFTMVPFLNAAGYPDFQNRLFEYYVKKPIGKHNYISVGQQRTPNTVEGCRSVFGLPVGRRAQLGNTYSNICAIGAKVGGDYDRVEYQAGVFDTGRFLQSTFESAPEVAALVSFKPIKNTAKYGKLKVGGSYSGGRRETSYGVYSGHILYDYKKAHVDFEYAYANGYNGRNISANKSDSFYSTFIYRLTPKFEPFLRVDTINANTALAGQRNTEYTVGAHYYLKGRKARFTLSYVYANHESKPDSNKIFSMLEILM